MSYRKKSDAHKDELRLFLEGIAVTKTEIAICEDRIRRLNDAAENTTTTWRDMPGGGSSDIHKDVNLTQLADELSKYTAACATFKARQLAAISLIDHLDNAAYRVLLTLRYVDCMTWSSIPEAMEKFNLYYCERQIYRLHGEALNAARKIYYGGEHFEDCYCPEKDEQEVANI